MLLRQHFTQKYEMVAGMRHPECKGRPTKTFHLTPELEHRPRMTNSTADTKNDTPVELQELSEAINNLPARYRDTLTPALGRVVECSTRRRRILNLVQEALSQLRLDMKYLIFDLEATRRERDQYRDTLENEGLL